MTGSVHRVLGITFAVAALAYVAFVLYGYQPAQVGSLRLPLSTIGAALNVIAWYGFIAVYWRSTRGAPRYMALRLWDASLLLMILASMGAWGLAVVTAAGIHSPVLSLGLTHLFLDLFADGWFLLALLGVAFVNIPGAASKRTARIGENLLVIGLPLTFLLSLPAGALPLAVRALAGLSAALAAVGLLLLLYALGASLGDVLEPGQKWLWGIAIFFLSLKALAFLIVSLPAGAAWSVRMGLRISYLHWLLLGGVTMGLLAAARAQWGPRAAAAWRPLLASIIFLLLSLLPMTRLWPSALGGRWTLVVAAWATVAPVFIMMYVLFKATFNSHDSSIEPATGRLSTRAR